jgi:hypothetical protein
MLSMYNSCRFSFASQLAEKRLSGRHVPTVILFGAGGGVVLRICSGGCLFVFELGLHFLKVPEPTAEDYSHAAPDVDRAKVLWGTHNQEEVAEPKATKWRNWRHHTPSWTTKSLGLLKALAFGVSRDRMWLNQLIKSHSVLQHNGEFAYVLSSSSYGLRVLKLNKRTIGAHTLLDPVGDFVL